jgi:hypothetical protein
MKNHKTDEKKNQKTAEMGKRIVLHNVARELTAAELELVNGGLIDTGNPYGTMDGPAGLADDQ